MTPPPRPITRPITLFRTSTESLPQNGPKIGRKRSQKPPKRRETWAFSSLGRPAGPLLPLPAAATAALPALFRLDALLGPGPEGRERHHRREHAGIGRAGRLDLRREAHERLRLSRSSLRLSRWRLSRRRLSRRLSLDLRRSRMDASHGSGVERRLSRHPEVILLHRLKGAPRSTREALESESQANTIGSGSRPAPSPR